MKDVKISVFKDLYKSKEVPFIITLEKSLERIREGKSKDIIEFARAGKDKEEYNKRKSKLPCIVFAGEFKDRSKKGLINHSGLMVIDFDGYENDDIMFESFNEIKKNKHLITLFISPSNKGLKGVIKIPSCNAIDHEKYFKAFNNEFEYPYFDKSNCNVDRVCYESYDPNIYINYEAETYSPKLIDEGYEVRNKVPLVPLLNESDIIDKIMAFDWGKGFVEGERNAFLFDLAGQFCEYGISQSTAEGYILNNVVIGSFSERETITTIKSAYKVREYNTKYFKEW